ncbi:MAG: hypothetical protein J1G30_03355 [Spirochaetales bacterium]|nr:hypothetical protein [Spirochaetales bacterium]
MNIITLLFYPLLCFCALPVIIALTNHKERIVFFRCYFIAMVVSTAWVLLFGKLESFPYNHIKWQQVFIYYLLLDHQGLLGIILCTISVLLINSSKSEIPTWLKTIAVLLGVNTIFSASQILRSEIPNNLFELLTPLSLNILIGLLIFLSKSLVKEKKQWWIIGVSAIVICICCGIFNCLLFFYKPLHCISIIAAALGIFSVIQLKKKRIIDFSF